MTKDRLLTRARTLAELAPDQEIAVSTLTGESGQFSDGSPLSEPPASYLGPTEALAFLLANTKQGVRVGTSDETIVPGDSRETLILVTGRRTLCLVGGSDGDERIEIPHRSVVGVSYESGFLGYRLVLQTTDSVVRCWINPNTPVDRVAEATAFIDRKIKATPDGVRGTDIATYGDRPLD